MADLFSIGRSPPHDRSSEFFGCNVVEYGEDLMISTHDFDTGIYLYRLGTGCLGMHEISQGPMQAHSLYVFAARWQTIL